MSFAPQIIFGFIISFALASRGIKIHEATDPQIEIFITLGSLALAPLLVLPFLKNLFNAKNYSSLLSFCNVKNVRFSYTILTIVFILALEFFFDVLSHTFNIPVDPFTIELKHFMSTVEKSLLVIVAICIMAPLIEELIFRGWLFKKLIKTSLGNSGTLLFTSIIFTILHFQYEHTISLIFIFTSSIVLGLIRLKTGNTSYTIVAHCVTNTYVVFMPVWFNS